MNLKNIVFAAAIATCVLSLDVAANDIAKGQCSACHGADGNSINPEWPNLAGQHAKYIAEQLHAYKNGDRENPNMSAMVTNLSDDDMLALGRYYAGEQPKIGTIKSDQVAAGERLYRGGDKEAGIPACMGCHGPNGAGNPAANYPALRGQHAVYTSIQLKAYRDGDRTTDTERTSMMQTIARRLSDGDIENVSRYVQALY